MLYESSVRVTHERPIKLDCWVKNKKKSARKKNIPKRLKKKSLTKLTASKKCLYVHRTERRRVHNKRGKP